ncbi:DUF4424 domain-containing protein [Sinorhizobium sp. BG8]|uniref:DUF4424 domain-containing protein n=1 Tax=Sinorhizobium sp. BG8 TaxID=2613773 RepID=UPI00193D24A1|nr:DUF4424 domain-containing protein [Sinorhizobium sp. BG8]QRM54544.1 DUF4424 domain-containing protein [Sinorhizobium sp. BG8]
MRHALSIAVLAMVLGSVPAHANDTMAELRTGGLTFVRTPDIEMLSEDLFISPEEIRVEYVFRNTSSHDVKGLVAFPMPDIGGDPYANVAMGDVEADNYLSFTAAQDGQAVAVALDQHAFAASLDVTGVLKERGISLLPYSRAAREGLAGLPAEVVADWVSRGIVFVDRYDDDGTGMKDHVTPLWTLKSTYWWNTVFPAGREVRVTHRYAPSVGGTIGISFLEDGKARGERLDDYRRRYCIDEPIIRRAVQSAAAMAANRPYLSESWISYVLTTGANWGGPIGSFRLTIDKGRPENLVSFCGEGVRKIGPTTFEMRATDFIPQKDIDILLLRPSGP